MSSLSTEQAREIHRLQRSRGRLFLAKCLQMKKFEEELDMRQSILLDYLYGNFTFAVNKGFQWKQVCAVLELSRELQAKTMGVPLLKAVKIVNRIVSENVQGLTETNMKIFLDHFFLTYMQHYSIYQYVFTQEREKMIGNIELEVKPPEKLIPFREGKEFKIWDYEQKIEELQAKEQSRKEEIAQKKLAATNDQEEILNMSFSDLSPEVSLEREALSKLIEETASKHASITLQAMEAKIEEKHTSLSFYLERTALPRPAALGPPPRIKSPSKSPRGSGKSRADLGSRDTNRKSLEAPRTTKSSAKSSRTAKTPKP